MVYPGAGHRFNADISPAYSKEATADAQTRTVAFFKERLPQPWSAWPRTCLC